MKEGRSHIGRRVIMLSALGKGGGEGAEWRHTLIGDSVSLKKRNNREYV